MKLASKALKESNLSLSCDASQIRSLRDTLSEINDSVEELKSGINALDNPPIRFNK